jgi:hypothetical protein
MRAPACSRGLVSHAGPGMLPWVGVSCRPRHAPVAPKRSRHWPAGSKQRAARQAGGQIFNAQGTSGAGRQICAPLTSSMEARSATACEARTSKTWGAHKARMGWARSKRRRVEKGGEQCPWCLPRAPLSTEWGRRSGCTNNAKRSRKALRAAPARTCAPASRYIVRSALPCATGTWRGRGQGGRGRGAGAPCARDAGRRRGPARGERGGGAAGAGCPRTYSLQQPAVPAGFPGPGTPQIPAAPLPPDTHLHHHQVRAEFAGLGGAHVPVGARAGVWKARGGPGARRAARLMRRVRGGILQGRLRGRVPAARRARARRASAGAAASQRPRQNMAAADERAPALPPARGGRRPHLFTPCARAW